MVTLCVVSAIKFYFELTVTITTKYSLSRVLIERCGRGWKLNESQQGKDRASWFRNKWLQMLRATLGNGVSDRTCGTKNWFSFMILAAILWFHNLCYGFVISQYWLRFSQQVIWDRISCVRQLRSHNLTIWIMILITLMVCTNSNWQWALWFLYFSFCFLMVGNGLQDNWLFLLND